MKQIKGMATAMLALYSGAAWAQTMPPSDPAKRTAASPQETPSTTNSAATGAVDQAGPPPAPGATPAPATSEAPATAGDVVVTATRRASRLSDVPVAVSAITPDQLRNTGATDIRQLTQVAPSLFVFSGSSETGGSSARIRGVGTIGENPGLEASVATFIDGVYRSRAGVALTELGPVEGVEVLRGPQGTLFGRNASAGLINITTANPKDTLGGYAEGSYGNYDYYRFAGGITGPIGQSGVDFRLDGVYNHRDGFLTDVISGRKINNRDRYLLRGKLKFAPTSNLSVLLIGDYSKLNEECCGADFLPAANRTRNADGTITTTPSTIAALERNFTSVVPGSGNGLVLDNPYARQVAITPGRNYRSDVQDYGTSLQIDWKLDKVSITSISAYRYNKFIRGQDADFTNLDLLYRSSDGSGFTRFQTFSQELRAQGQLFDNKLDWLVGGYYANEKLGYNDNISYGQDYDAFATALGAAGLTPVNAAVGGLFGATGFNNLNGFTQRLALSQLAALPAATRNALAGAIASQVQNVSFAGTGVLDQFRQTDNNYAIFTHNILHLTDKLSLTIGARHTWDDKSLNANLSSNTACGTYVANITRLNALAASGQLGPASALASTIANSVLAPLTALPCVINSTNGQFSGKRKESEWTGTAVVSYKPTDRLLTYASVSRGYKAGGFNLDRAPFVNSATGVSTVTPNLTNLQFAPEKVDAFEVGGKFRGHGFDLNVAAFYERFSNFQLNTFSGTAFFVTNIQGCQTNLGTTDTDQISGNSNCPDTESGVISRGVEAEAFLYPARDFTVSTGITYADTKYRNSLAVNADATGNNSLPPALSLLPGGRVSLSSDVVVTGSAQWTPPVGGLRALVYGDFRYSSALHTSSDLFPEKDQPGFVIVNVRIGIGPQNGRWSLEVFARNLFNTNYLQTAFSAPLQGSNTSYAQLAAGQASTQLYGAFLGDPRTFGMTARTKF